LTDQLVSAQPGLIPQISGKLTHQCVNGATVFVNHFSDHVYAYLMRDVTLDETIAAKHGYESYLSLLGIKSQGYHADNGRFADKDFGMIAWTMTNPSHVVELVAIIRMALQKEKSNILRLVLEQYYFTPNKCFLNISPLSFGVLHSNALKIE
jgi:hypothetical protein